jgi:hypothetical protein
LANAMKSKGGRDMKRVGGRIFIPRAVHPICPYPHAASLVMSWAFILPRVGKCDELQ